MEIFVKYRKPLIAACIIAFLFIISELYKSIEYFSVGSTGRAVGAIVNFAIGLFAICYLLIQIRKANRNIPKDETPMN